MTYKHCLVAYLRIWFGEQTRPSKTEVFTMMYEIACLWICHNAEAWKLVLHDVWDQTPKYGKKNSTNQQD